MAKEGWGTLGVIRLGIVIAWGVWGCGMGYSQPNDNASATAVIQTGQMDQAAETNEKKGGGHDGCIHIDSLELQGNRAISTARLKLRMKTWHSSLMPGNLNCFNEKWLQKDIDSVIELYRKKGYPDIDVRYTINENSDENHSGKKSAGKSTKISKSTESIDIILEIREGLQYELVFEGNAFYSDRALKKKIDLVKKGNIRDAALKKGKVNIRQYYLDAGFQEVNVIFEKSKKVVEDSQEQEKTDAEIWHVRYLIEEGDQVVVNRLTISGNGSIEEKEILDVMLTREKGMLTSGGFNEKVLKKDINAIELLYLSKGFLNVNIDKTIDVEETAQLEKTQEVIIENEVEKKHDDPSVNASQGKDERDEIDVQLVNITISVDEGIQTLVSKAEIVGLDNILSMDDALTKLSLNVGLPFREYMITSDANLLGMLISEKGYPHVKVVGDAKLSQDRQQAEVTWHVESGSFTRFGTVRYSGNTRLQEDIIHERLTVTPGEPFSLRQVLISEKQIRESSAVKSVRINAPGLNRMEAAPDLEVMIEENLPYYVEAAIGYDTEQTFYLEAEIGDNNFLGREIDAWIAAKVSGIGYRVESGLSKPYLWGTPFHAVWSLYAEDEEALNQEFGTRTFGGEAGVTRALWIKGLTAGLNLKYENRQTYGDVDPEEQETRNILITTGSLGYDTRDSSVRPTKGMLSTASVDLFTGFDTDLDRFFKYKLDLRKYVSPITHVVFALRTRLGYIQPFGSEDSVAEDQLFFLGGTSDVRGFKENMLDFDLYDDPVGGRTSINATLEARIELPANFEVNCFLDAGRVGALDPDADSESALDSSGFRSSAGVGLRYITPIGPLGVLYGYKLDREEGEDAGRIHVSVGYTF